MGSIAAALLLCAPAAAQVPDPGAGARRVLAAKCVECHHPGSEERKARREFDGMRDLRAVVRELVVPHDLLLSDLWLVVEEGEMPPDDSDVPPLTAEESEALRHWIESGAALPRDGDWRVPLPGEALPPLVTGTPGEEGLTAPPVVEPQRRERGFLERARIFLGRLHAATTHFSVGLLCAAALARLLGGRGGRGRGAEGFCLVTGTAAALLTAPLGWLNAHNAGAEGLALEWHRWMGVGVTAAALLLCLLRRRAAERSAYGWALGLLAVAVLVTGHLGGVQVFGAGYYDVLFG